MPQPVDTKYPRVFQGTKLPVFEGPGGADFSCSSCGAVLVKSFDGRSLAAIDIECNSCGEVTRTPDWPDKEAMPVTRVSLGSSGRYRMDGTVKLDGHAILTTDQELTRIFETNGARRPNALTIEISSDWLESLVVELDIFTNGDFGRSVVRARRAWATGNRQFTRSPLAWAIVRLQASLSENLIDFQSADGIALSYIQLYREVVQRWGHHPLFGSVVRAIDSEFHHFIAALITASYLVDAGNSVGFTDTAAEGGRSPDLYVNTRVDERLSIEVKAPTALNWPQENPSKHDIERAIIAATRSAAGQITGASGIVVLSGSCFYPQFAADFKNEIEKTLLRGKISRRIQAVCSVIHVASTEVGSDLRLNSVSHFALHRNPRFDGVISVQG